MDGPSGRAGPLAGLRVIDLTQVLSGPFCTMLLADLGADVVKIEPPDGDVARLWGPHPPGESIEGGYGGYFASVNRNKRSVCLDLKTEDGPRRAARLLADADVLVENFRVGVMERLGLSYELLHARFPRLVYATIRGFGDPRTGASPVCGLAGVRHHRPGDGRHHGGYRPRRRSSRQGRSRRRGRRPGDACPRSGFWLRCATSSGPASVSSSMSPCTTACSH